MDQVGLLFSGGWIGECVAEAREFSLQPKRLGIYAFVFWSVNKTMRAVMFPVIRLIEISFHR